MFFIFKIFCKNKSIKCFSSLKQFSIIRLTNMFYFIFVPKQFCFKTDLFAIFKNLKGLLCKF